MEALKVWLEQNQISQNQLADRLNVTPGAVSQWLSGATKPTVGNLKLLREITGLTFDQLIEQAA